MYIINKHQVLQFLFVVSLHTPKLEVEVAGEGVAILLLFRAVDHTAIIVQ
jgi:hypothetical protein